jgi:two-component system probable response regulator PhcQ
MKPRVLYVDDEPHCLKALKRLFRNEPFHFITFDSPHKALLKLDEIKPAVVVSDQLMPEMEGTQFLEEVKKTHPDAVRILLTGHAELEVAIAAINQGNVFRFITKPWNDGELKAEIASALEYHEEISELRRLAERKRDEIGIQSERLQGARELAITVRHELDQSMTVVSGYAYLIQHYLRKDPLLDTYLSNIVTQMKKMEEITRKITSITRYETTVYAGKERMIDIKKASSDS